MTCILLAIKFSEDIFYDNKFYSEIGGIALNEMNKLERECFNLLDNSLLIHDEQFNKYYQCLNPCAESI